MLLFFLSSLLFSSNSLSLDKLPARETVADDIKMGADDVMMHIQMVMRNQTGNSKSLIESLEKLDPATIASVVVLVEQLLASVAADLLALQQASDVSISAYNDANGAHDAAVVEKVRLDEVILAHQASLAEQVIVVQSTLDTKNTASGAKINAQATLDAGSSRLNGEHSTLTQVLGLINGLAPGSASAPVLTLGSPNQISNADCYTACNGNVAVPQSVEETDAMRLLVKATDPVQIWLGIKKVGGEWKRNDVLYTGWTNWKSRYQGWDTGEPFARMIFTNEIWSGQWFGVAHTDIYCICQG